MKSKQKHFQTNNKRIQNEQTQVFLRQKNKSSQMENKSYMKGHHLISVGREQDGSLHWKWPEGKAAKVELQKGRLAAEARKAC